MRQGSILSFFQKRRPTQPGQPYPYTSGIFPNSKTKSTKQHRGPDRRRNTDLKEVADETKTILPQILTTKLGFDATASSIHNLKDLPPLDAKDCPGFVLRDGNTQTAKKGAQIRVWDMDTFDAALKLEPNYKLHTHLGLITHADDESNESESTAMEGTNDTEEPLDDTAQNSAIVNAAPSKHNASSSSTAHSSPKPVAVLNLASERSPGGGWQNGALAQEECLCYRSSLYLSLHKSFYPIPSLSAIHTPNVLLIRDSMSRGHGLLVPAEQPQNLPVVSVISVAALRRPNLTDDRKRFKHEGQRTETRRKIRVVLRLAATQGHTKLVLGALGCGVFGNPPGEVARCFLDVLNEREFQGGWWEDIVFAVMDNVKGGGKDGDGNFGHFYRVLNGQVV